VTRLFNEPSDFADEMVDGFVAANSRWIRRVHGGVVRARRAPAGAVAIVTGGGSGHYPAFGGFVGEGLTHGAALGNLFASPSWQQVRSVAKSANSGGGVLLCYGNYAGDVLNFDKAQERLCAEGIETQTVTVTDDISSASVEDRHRRRGVAGDLVVLKSAGAASDAGYDLAGVKRVATKANDRTRSFGVAFSGCSLPGEPEPLFIVPAGRMAVGMGIHGEPGIGEVDVPSADQLAEQLVTSLLDELPDDIEQASGQRVALILNGLGSVKYEELFVVYAKIDALLDVAGVQVVEPEVGELVTSFDMAGVSLTLTWLDDELEDFWRAPVNAPGYRKVTLPEPALGELAAAEAVPDRVVPDASTEARETAARVLLALEASLLALDKSAVELGRIDAVAGDGDHGIGMKRGATAAVEAARTYVALGAGGSTVLNAAGDAWSDRAGGTSGALWGAILESMGAEFTDTAHPNSMSIAAAVHRATLAILEFGAVVGDKTMVDVLVPFDSALTQQISGGASLLKAWLAASAVADKASLATADLLPRMGRARPHAEKSLGTPDAGAISLALLIREAGDALLSSQREH